MAEQVQLRKYRRERESRRWPEYVEGQSQIVVVGATQVMPYFAFDTTLSTWGKKALTACFQIKLSVTLRGESFKWSILQKIRPLFN